VNPSGNEVACVVSPNAMDAGLAVSFLGENGIRARAAGSVRDVLPLLDHEIGCLILVEEALLAEDLPALREALQRMPAWNDLPIIVVSRELRTVATLAADFFPESGNVTLLERPLSPLALVSAVQVALRAAARQREIGELIEQRSQAVKLRDEFLAMLAHELRNPLAPMRNALYVMRLRKIMDPELLKSTQILERQVNHIVRMVDDLMDVARLERGKVVLQKQRVDLNRVVASALEACLPFAQERGHQVIVHFDTRDLPVNADPVRLEQIVCNLVNNAAKFTNSPGEIRVDTSRDERFASIAVRDNGIGFEPAEADNLFDPFLQGNPTLERSRGGLGMGLTIVRRLAMLHDGLVEASSDGPGKGACFVARIPLASAAIEAQPAPERRGGKARRHRIVVIEDNPDIRETLYQVLILWGHQVTTASDGVSGVERVLQERPDIALIDVGLPGMNGYDVARAIRKGIPNGGIRLIALTGYGQPSDREEALRAGFDTHLLKPVAPEILENLLA